MRQIHVLDSVPPFRRGDDRRPVCSTGFDVHDWAQLVFAEMTVAIRCQTCGRDPLDIVAEWRLGQWTDATY